VCSVSALAALEAINSSGLQFNTQHWRAFIINVVGSAAEFPGAVHYLADSLSQEGLSILHISTFESEVFLVQEQDLERACAIFRRTENPNELAGLMEHGQRQRTGSAPSSSALSNLPPLVRAQSGEQGTSSDKDIDNDAITELSVSQHQFKDGFILRVIPSQVMLARLNDDFTLRQCSDILVS
jgi:ACT domain